MFKVAVSKFVQKKSLNDLLFSSFPSQPFDLLTNLTAPVVWKHVIGWKKVSLLHSKTKTF